jgi:hypothetical protein
LFSLCSSSFAIVFVGIYASRVLTMKTFSVILFLVSFILCTSNVYAGGGHHGLHDSRHHGGHAGDHLVGGLIVANVMGHLSHRRAHFAAANEAVVDSSTDIDRWLLLDLKGRCYEVSRQEDGTEVRKEVEKNV